RVLELSVGQREAVADGAARPRVLCPALKDHGQSVAEVTECLTKDAGRLVSHVEFGQENIVRPLGTLLVQEVGAALHPTAKVLDGDRRHLTSPSAAGAPAAKACASGSPR